jgi:hypothetical protein
VSVFFARSGCVRPNKTLRLVFCFYTDMVLSGQSGFAVITVMKKLLLSTRIKVATLLMWLLAGLACSPFLFTVFRLANLSTEPPGDDQNMLIRYWFLTWGIALTLLVMLGFVLALDWRRTLQDSHCSSQPH